jgi:hypothetical protein
VTEGNEKRVRSVYYGELDKICGSIPYDLSHVGRVRRELALLSLLFDKVYIPPKCIIEHPVTLPAMESLDELVQTGRIGTSIDPSEGSLHDLMRSILEQMLSGIPKNPFPNTHAHQLRKRSKDLISRLDAVLPQEPIYLRDIGVQVSRFSGSILKYMEETVERSEAFAFRTFLQEARRSFDVDKGGRWQWVVTLGRLLNVLHRQEADEILTTVNAAYFRQGEEANDCLWFPGRFKERLRGRELPDYILPSTARSALSFERLIRSARCLGVELETALDLPAARLLELGGQPEMQRFAKRLLAVILEPGERSEWIIDPMEAKRLACGALKDVRDWLANQDPNEWHYRAAVDFAATDLSHPLRWSKVMRVISLGGLAEDSHGDIAYDPVSRMIEAGGIAKILSRGMARLLEFFLMYPQTNLTLREVDEYLMEWVHIDSERRLDRKLLPDEEESLKMRTYKLKERFNKELEPFCLEIAITQGRWTLVGMQRIRIVRNKAERARPENPVRGHVRLWMLFEKLADHYPGYASKEALARALNISEDEEQKVWWAVDDLKKYLRNCKEEWTVFSDRVGNYRLDKNRR